MNELISVIVPVYNVEKYLKRCVDSILNQTYKNLEIILVDDESPDNCPAICDEYAKKDSRIKVIHKTNGGLSDARNAGIIISGGKYIAFVDSDDYISYEMIQILYDRIKEDKSDMAICNFTYVDEAMNGISKLNGDMPIKDRKLSGYEALMSLTKPRCHYYVTAWNKLYNKKLFEDILFPIGKLHEDEFVVHKIFDKCQYVSCVEKPMYYYVQREQSIVHTAYSVKRLDAVEAFFQRCEFCVKRNLTELAVSSFNSAIGYLSQGYGNINGDKDEIKKRVKMLKKDYNALFPQIIKENIPMKNKIQMGLFYISPKLHRSLKNKSKRRKNNL